MRAFLSLVARFGHFVVLAGLVFIALLIFTNHFGVAERATNYILILAIIVVTFRLFKGKQYSMSQEREKFSDRFLILGWLGIVIATLLVFRAIFLSGPVVWGDAPYFYPETFKDFLGGPVGWESRGKLGVAIDLYWIYPLMLIYWGLGVLGLSNDLVIRLVFYFPAIFFSFLSPWLFSRYLGFSPLVRLFSVLVYVLNTYFVLLIDGGQVGVALAYGIFPITLLHLHKLITNNKTSQFFTTLAFLVLLIAADVRFAMICVFTFALWVGFEKKISGQDLKKFVLFTGAVLVLSSYWLIPVLAVEPTTGSITRAVTKLISVLNTVFLFQPHWPLNEFGRISAPYWFFVGAPFLVLANLFFRQSKRVLIFLFLFLFFAFLTKGETDFGGNFYAWVIDTIPLGGAFSDSTKFFTPLFLFGGILIGISVESFSKVFARRIFSKAVVVLVYVYLLFLVRPAIDGGMTGVLAGKELPDELKRVADRVSLEKGFLRTVWFPEHHPFSFDTEEKPAVDAKKLVDYRPFASINTGTLDRFNFLHNKQFLEWLDVFGVKYLVFSGDARRVVPNNDAEEDWQKLFGLVEGVAGLDRVDLNTRFPIYQTRKSKPRVFAVDKLLAVVGSDDIYQKLIDSESRFSIGNQGFVFLEDGKFDPSLLGDKDKDSVVVVFNETKDIDLTMSFLRKYLISPKDRLDDSHWAVRSSSDYLGWRYEFLVNGVEMQEFDLGKGVAFSTVGGEKINFRLNVPQEGEYVLAVRSLTRNRDEKLESEAFGGRIDYRKEKEFEWHIKKGIVLSKGNFEVSFKNTDGFHALSTVALIPRADFDKALGKSEELLGKFPVIRLDGGTSDKESLENLAKGGSGWNEVDNTRESSVRYRVSPNMGYRWLIFTDSYHPLWRLVENSSESQSIPVYSALNGFYVDNPVQESKIEFGGQKYVRLGFYISGAGAVAVVLLYLYYLLRTKRRWKN